ncbi:MAG: chitobiase/beta-hexosaminidase C-terminal domain-containing protein, partial [Gammaproteobacteria bacterium]
DVGGGTARNNIAAVESVGVGAGAGAVNATWNPGANGTVTRLLFSASNIYVGGDFTRIGGLNRDRLAEISIASPVSVMNWDPSIGDTINSLMLDGTTLFVGGDFTSTGGVTRNYVAAIDQITGIPTSWNPSANNVVYSIALSDAGDRLFLGGSFTSVGGQSRSKIAAISTATGIADAWNPGADGDIRSMLLTSGGLFVGGDFTLIDGAFRNRLARLNVVNTNPGSIVFGWDPDVNNTVRTMAMRGSTLYIGGDFFTVNGGFNPRFFIAALDSNQADAKDWAPDADGPVYSLLINNDILYAGGEFNTIDKKTRKFIAALDTANTDNIAIDWKVGVDAPVKALSISGDDSTLYIGGEFVNVEVETVDANNDPVILTKSHNRLAALALERDEAQKIISASPLDWWNASSSASVLSMTLSGDGNMLYTGGDFGAINNATQTGLAAFEVLPPFTSALPASNSFQGAQNITLSCNDGPGTGCVATYYTNDDTTPTLLSNVYTTNIPVSVDTTIQYFSVDQSGNQEKARSTKYVIDDQAPTVTAKPVGGTYGTTADRTIELNCVDVGNAGCDAIYYTTGETPETTDIPTFTSTKYDSPIDVTENTTIKFFAVDKAGNFETFIPQGAGSPQAAISVETYEIDLDLPRTIITPDSKVFTSQSLTITLKCDDVPEEQEELPGADPNAPVEETPTSTVTGCNAIYYTLDDTTPTLTSTRYTTPIRINDSTVIKYRSVDNAGNVEPTKRSTYIKNYGGFGTVGVVMVVLSMLGIVLQQRYRRVI